MDKSIILDCMKQFEDRKDTNNNRDGTDDAEGRPDRPHPPSVLRWLSPIS